jgi:LPXTG-motif cell wall-anchored protein
MAVGALLVVGFVPGSADATSQSPQTATADCVGDHFFKIDQQPVEGQTYSGNGLTVTITDITIVGQKQDKHMLVSFTTSIPVSAVYVKAANGGNLYTFNPPVSSASGLESPKDSISHLTFCWSDETTTTTAEETTSTTAEETTTTTAEETTTTTKPDDTTTTTAEETTTTTKPDDTTTTTAEETTTTTAEETTTTTKPDDTTTTTAEETTTTTAEETTTTTKPDDTTTTTAGEETTTTVPDETTTSAPRRATTTLPGDSVTPAKPVKVTTSVARAGQLPRTGSDTSLPIVAGLGLLTLGGVLVASSRRLRPAPVRRR